MLARNLLGYQRSSNCSIPSCAASNRVCNASLKHNTSVFKSSTDDSIWLAVRSKSFDSILLDRRGVYITCGMDDYIGNTVRVK